MGTTDKCWHFSPLFTTTKDMTKLKMNYLPTTVLLAAIICGASARGRGFDDADRIVPERSRDGILRDLDRAISGVTRRPPAREAPSRRPAPVRCGANEVANERGGCDCDRGFVLTRDGCVKPTPVVRCGPNEVANERGGCECDRGFQLTRAGCVKPTPVVECGRGEVADGRGGCECIRGFERTRAGCERPAPVDTRRRDDSEDSGD